MSILQMSIFAGVLVIAIVIIRAASLNRLPKTMLLMLWGVALLRLLVPVSIPLPFSVSNAIGTASSAIMPPVVENLTHAADIPGAVQGQAVNTDLITVIWLTGMTALFFFFAVVHFRNHRELRFATLIRDHDFLDKWLTGHKLLRHISILQSDRITTPIAAGLIKPRIILPKSMDMDDQQRLNYVLAHEYYHIKRLDILWKSVLVFTLCAHWFNPLIWVMFILASRDLELTCDEMVIRHFGIETKTAYAHALIEMAERRSKFTLLYNGFSKNATEERIVSIMKTKKATLTGVIFAIVLVSAMTIGVLAASDTNDKPTAEPSRIAVTAKASESAGTAPTARNSESAAVPPNYDKSNVISEAQAIESAKKIFRYIGGEKYGALSEECKYTASFIEYSIQVDAPIWRITAEHKKVKTVAAWINALTGESIYDPANMLI